MPKATNLWRDPRTGVYVWRRTNELTGRRFRKSTGTKILRIALAKVRQFEEEYERQLAGLSKFEGYRRPLEGFLDPFFESLSCGDRRMEQLRMELPRAFRLLGLSVLADLEDFTKIEAKLVRLNGGRNAKGGFSRTALARSFQAPLKQFSRYLAGRREIGAASLDGKTLAEIVEYVGDRAEGPLFLSPEGGRIDTRNSIRRWRMCVSLAMVDMEWPDSDNEPRDLKTEYLVHHALTAGKTTGKVSVAMGGPLSGPNAPGRKKRESRAALAARIRLLADTIRPARGERMRGIDQHCLRMTHRTWALAAGVPEILIDRQLGHASPAGDAALHAAWSAVGRAHYTDMGFLTLDARRSAEAVREALDRAEEALRDVALRRGTALAAAPAVTAAVV
jgi:integrase